MKKILFTCDGDHFPEGAFKFIKLLQDVEPVTLKGMFFTEIALPQLTSISYILYAESFSRLKEFEYGTTASVDIRSIKVKEESTGYVYPKTD